MIRRVTPLFLAAAALAPLLWSTAAWAPYHLAVIEQVYFGHPDCPNAQYVMIRTQAAGQVVVGGQTVSSQNGDGSAAADFGTFEQAFLDNGQSGAAILIATAEAEVFLGLRPDQVATGRLVFPDGRICFASFGGQPVDCVAYGDFTGNNGNFGDPALDPQIGMALFRKSSTDNNADDFELRSPAPENNAGERGIPAPCGGAATATPTVTSAAVTPTLGTPPPTATARPPGPCVGDCNGDAMVAINEIVLAVNIVLGLQPASVCTAFPGEIRINDLVLAVSNVLSGCPATPAPTTAGASTPTEAPTVIAGTPTETRTPGGPLGVRRFSLNPQTSSLIAILSPGFSFPSTGFEGFLELTAGVPDPVTGVARVDVTDASDYLAINVPAGGLTLCMAIDKTQLPIMGAGIVACNGGLPLGIDITQDHNIGTVGACSGGANDSLACTNDGDCPEASCFTAEACTEAGGSLEGPEDAHPGVCNSAFGGNQLAGDSGPGAVVLVPDPGNQLVGLPVSIGMEEALPCGDEGAPGMAVAIGLTSGQSVCRIINYNNDVDELTDERMGENFSCAAWEVENGPGTLVLAAPQLDIMALGPVPTDIISAFVLDD